MTTPTSCCKHAFYREHRRRGPLPGHLLRAPSATRTRSSRSHGEGNGPIDAFFNAIHGREDGPASPSLDYKSHAITDGSDSQGVAYIQLQDQRDGQDSLGAWASAHNINLAPLRGILSAINRSKRSAQ